MSKEKITFKNIHDCPRCDEKPRYKKIAPFMTSFSCPSCGYRPHWAEAGMFKLRRELKPDDILKAAQLWNDSIAEEYGWRSQPVYYSRRSA